MCVQLPAWYYVRFLCTGKLKILCKIEYSNVFWFFLLKKKKFKNFWYLQETCGSYFRGFANNFFSVEVQFTWMSYFLGNNNVLLVNLHKISIDFNFLPNTEESFQIVGVDYPFHYFHMSTDRNFLKVDKNLVEKGGKGVLIVHVWCITFLNMV